jgi:glycosyltransferase involved in cell wall biosynthesis
MLSYNKEPFIGAALESLGRQTYRDIEFIVIDDCSVDGSLRIVEEWCDMQKFPCRLIRHRVNQGVCRSLNEAIGMARGQYLAFHGSDDLWHPDFLERFVGHMSQLADEVAVLYGDAEVIDERGASLSSSFIDMWRQFDRPPEGKIFYELLKGNFIPAMAVLCRIESIRSVGGYDESLWYEDWDMWLRLAERYEFALAPSQLAKYRVVATSMTQSADWESCRTSSQMAIRLKWLGRDARSDAILEKSLGLPWTAERLYAAGHPRARRYAVAWFWREPRARSLAVAIGAASRLPYPVFQRVSAVALAARRRIRHEV